MNLTFIEKIIILPGSSPETIFEVVNTIAKTYGVTKDTILLINDKSSVLEEIIIFFKKNKRNVAEIELQDGARYNLKKINFMSIE